MEKDLSVEVNGIRFENPFVVGSGPPGTNKRTILKAFKEGWGGVVAKTATLEAEKIRNVSPRYGKLYSRESNEMIGFQNIELISDRPIEDWLVDYREIKAECPGGVLIASIMERYDRNAWQDLVRMVQDTGVDGFELNFSCPHGLPERKMGAAMGQDPEIVREVTGWVTEVAEIPVWAKMTPNVTDIAVPALHAVEAGADGISLINTILAVIGIDLKTLRPLPTVEGFSIPGGYSSQAVRPIALRHVLRLVQALQAANRLEVSISGMGGIQRGTDAVQFLLLGAHTVQSCTGPMLQGFAMVKELKQGLTDFMLEHNFDKVSDFVGKSLEFFTTHAELVRLKDKKVKRSEQTKDTHWSGEEIMSQAEAISSN